MKKFLVVVFLLIVIVGLGAVLFGSVVWGRMHEPYKGYTAAEQFIEIPSGAGAHQIGRRLVAAEIVRDEFIFRAAMRLTGGRRSLKAGEYRFDRPLSAVEVVDRLARGDVYAHRITFPEGLTIAEMAKIYETRGFGGAPEFVRAASDVSSIVDLDPQASDLEGYLFPETYSLPRGTPAATLIRSMIDRFRAAYTADLQAAAQAQGLTTRQVVTLASLVEEETGKPEERPIVAAVYRNRMQIGMPMQADPTLIYALQKAGRYDGNIRRGDLAFDSPYNTYRYPGLPPGPIASPGAAALEAAVKPADVPYLYFVSRNDGSHVFAANLREHNRNVRQFQVLFFRDNVRPGFTRFIGFIGFLRCGGRGSLGSSGSLGSCGAGFMNPEPQAPHEPNEPREPRIYRSPHFNFSRNTSK